VKFNSADYMNLMSQPSPNAMEAKGK
jgi:hypothetical protein